MSRLGDLLHDVDAALDDWWDSPHSWSPGDPLWTMHPCTEACDELLDQCTAACVGVPSCEHECGHQVLRPMAELFHWTAGAEVSTLRLDWCMTCDVGWEHGSLSTCWSCGVDPSIEMAASLALVREWLVEFIADVDRDPVPYQTEYQRMVLDRWVVGQ